MESFSALKTFVSARARPQPQNILSAAQFCAHFKILESFQSTLIQQFSDGRQALFP